MARAARAARACLDDVDDGVGLHAAELRQEAVGDEVLRVLEQLLVRDRVLLRQEVDRRRAEHRRHLHLGQHVHEVQAVAGPARRAQRAQRPRWCWVACSGAMRAGRTQSDCFCACTWRSKTRQATAPTRQAGVYRAPAALRGTPGSAILCSARGMRKGAKQCGLNSTRRELHLSQLLHLALLLTASCAGAGGAAKGCTPIELAQGPSQRALALGAVVHGDQQLPAGAAGRRAAGLVRHAGLASLLSAPQILVG
jgi:hypothetical protein